MMTRKLSVIATYATILEAEMAAERLDAAGIEAEVVRDDCGGAAPQLAFSLGVKLKVEAEDEQRAREVLEAVAGEKTPPWTCVCGAQVDAGYDVCWQCGAAHEG